MAGQWFSLSANIYSRSRCGNMVLIAYLLYNYLMYRSILCVYWVYSNIRHPILIYCTQSFWFTLQKVNQNWHYRFTIAERPTQHFFWTLRIVLENIISFSGSTTAMVYFFLLTCYFKCRQLFSGKWIVQESSVYFTLSLDTTAQQDQPHWLTGIGGLLPNYTSLSNATMGII